MNPVKLFGLILLGLGIAAFAYQGFRYTTTEKVLDVGPIHVTNEKTHSIPVPPVLAAIALIGGLGLLAFGEKKS